MMFPLSSRPVTRRRTVAGLGASGLGLIGSGSRTTAQEATPTTQDAVAIHRDIAYGEADGEVLRLDVVAPPSRDTPRPAVLLVHGGGWSVGDDGAFLVDTATKLAEAGYVAFNVKYRLMDGQPGHNVWPVQLDDVQRAVRWVRANATPYGVDPDRIGAYGYSAGGHLAAMLGTRDTRDNSDPELARYSSRVTCVVDFAGYHNTAIPDPDPLWDDLLVGFLGGTPDEVPETYRDASPVTWVDAGAAPFLLIHGKQDVTQPIAHSRQMVVALQVAGVEVVYAELAGVDHFAFADWWVVGPLMLAFFGMQLHPST